MFSFGFNSFWNSMHGSRAVQELLNKPDLQLDELLEEDGLLSELKTNNQRLLSLLLREENFKKLISYVILEPDAEEAKVNQKKGYKYPFVCADVLSSDCQPIVSEFFKTQKDLNEDTAIHKAEEIEDQDEVNTDSPGLQKEESTETSVSKEEKSVQEEGDKSASGDANSLPYINYLFTFLDSDEMNLTSAGYFAKIANNLFAKKPSELIAYLYEQKPVLLEKMAKHIASKSIAEFLAKVLTFDSSVLVSNDDEVYNTKRKEILQILLKKLEPKQDLEEINNTAYLICEVLGKYNSMHCSHEILQNLLDKQTIDYFFELLKTKDANTCCAVGLILGNIFAYYILINSAKPQLTSTEEIAEGDPQNQNEPPHPLELKEDIPLVSVFINNLDTIVQYIVNASGKAFPTQYGVEVTPFGSARLKLVELIIIAMKANNHKIYSKLVEHGFLDGLLELFNRYEWNNMLHNQVEKVITLILDSNYEELKKGLFEKTKLLDFVISAGQTTEHTMTGKYERKIRKGNIGQLTRIANKLADSKDPEIQKYTDEHKGWKEFVENQLAEINQKNSINLGGRDPRANEEEDYTDSNAQFSGMMQQFSNYFTSKGQDKDNDDDDDDYDEEEDHDKGGEHEKNDSDEDLNAREEGEEHEEDENKQAEEKSLFKSDESNQLVNENQEVGKSEDYNQEEDEEATFNKYTPQKDLNGYKNLENVKIDETVLDPEYNSNTYWKKDSWHSAEDILAEIEGL